MLTGYGARQGIRSKPKTSQNFGRSLSISKKKEDFFSWSVRPWIVCVEEIGVLAENIENGEIYKLMKNNGYILGSRTFLSSIYVLESKLDSLPSHYIKELKF